MKIDVDLNGTKENPWTKYGLEQNPFPQSIQSEFVPAMIRLQSLGGKPIPDTDYIRKVLTGFTPEFVELCCKNFKPGEIVRFSVIWEE